MGVHCLLSPHHFAQVGYWCVVPHPTVAGHSRVYYSVDAALPSWVPGFVVTAVTSKALTDATHWVKVESEKVSSVFLLAVCLHPACLLLAC